MLPKLMAKRERAAPHQGVVRGGGDRAGALFAGHGAGRSGTAELVGWTVEIVATDFVEEALNKARKGLYSQFEVQRGLPVSLLVKYFNKVGNGWELSPDIRGRVAFRTHNLLDGC